VGGLVAIATNGLVYDQWEEVVSMGKKYSIDAEI
jgi:hypothetical protein